VYPFPNRTQWLLASRYRHLVVALDGRLADSLIQARLASMQKLDRFRVGVFTLLSLGLIASVVSLVAAFVPILGYTAPFLQVATAISGGATGVLTLLYLAILRSLGQMEADILATAILSGLR
jgi:hypothetical protein